MPVTWLESPTRLDSAIFVREREPPRRKPERVASRAVPPVAPPPTQMPAIVPGDERRTGTAPIEAEAFRRADGAGGIETAREDECDGREHECKLCCRNCYSKV